MVDRLLLRAALLRAALILETAALTDDEKRLACRLALAAGAAFVKTSTGFHPSGGIRNVADALAMHAAGTNRIGTSASAAILKALGEG